MKTTRSLRVFQTEAQYNNAKNSFEYPTVAYVKTGNMVKYMKDPSVYVKQYLTFEALETGTFSLNIPSDVTSSLMTSVSYSIDNGETWVTTQVNNTNQTITTPTITAGNKVLWKGIGTKLSTSTSNIQHFESTCKFNVYGNIMSLLYGDDFINNSELPNNTTYTFARLFGGCNIVRADNLMLPAKIMKYCCYANMFMNCAFLTHAPYLPATTMAEWCYQALFQYCYALTNVQSILPATTLVQGCYLYMFYECDSLITAPILPALTLVSRCYEYMFTNCNNLNYIKAMFTTTPASSYTLNWVNGLQSTGTFVKNSAASWTTTGANGVPSGWTVQTAAS